MIKHRSAESHRSHRYRYSTTATANTKSDTRPTQERLPYTQLGSPMSAQADRNPLWMAVAALFPEHLPPSQDVPKHCATIWREQILADAVNLFLFHSTLTPEQLASQLVLEEWFRFQARYQGFEESATVTLREASTSSSISYHIFLARLYVMEFSLDPTRTDLRTESILHALRRAALQLSACERISLAMYEAIVGPLPANDESTPINFGIGIPPYRACLQPCHWLTTEEKRKGTPFYLWDVKKMETVPVTKLIEEMGNCPPYVAVSHTWGRWEVENEWIEMPGVPWRIPENSKFNIPETAEALKRTGWDYVWFDLFTIPQDLPRMTEEYAKVRKDEISRQATIFTNATRVIAWLKDANGWRGLRAVICWLSFNFLKHQGVQERDSGPTIDEMLTEFGKLINNFDLGVCNPSDTEIRLDTWFESLWALQEVCLRPDMWLYNRHWESFNFTTTLPATLSDIIALLKSSHNVVDGKPERYPGSVFVLDWAMRFSGIDNLLLMSPAAILSLGYKRFCRSRRAEAVMSAVGVTAWFTDEYDNAQETGCYPPAFITALRDRFGSAELFLSMPRRVDVRNLKLDQCGAPKAIGSLLPFGEERDSSTFECDNFSVFNLVEHPSVRHWMIEDTGSVRIVSAGIVSFSLLEQSTPIIVTIHGASPGLVAGDPWKGWELQKDIDLHEYLKSFGSAKVYAVCIQHCTQATRGVILAEIRPGLLVRIASYWAMDSTPYTEAQPIEWLVL